MIGRPVCAMPVAAHIAPAATDPADNLRLIDILCAFTATTLRTACYAPVRHIHTCGVFSFIGHVVFNAASVQPANWAPAYTHSAIFQPEES